MPRAVRLVRQAGLLVLPLLLAGCLVPRSTVVEEKLAVKCYSGGRVIYDGELTRRYMSITTKNQFYSAQEVSWYDDEGHVVVLDADCIGFRSKTAIHVVGGQPEARERCLKKCAGVPAYRRERCEERCPAALGSVTTSTKVSPLR